MRRKTWMWFVVGAGAAAGLLLGQRAAWTRSFGTPLADRLVTVARLGDEAVLLTAPGAEEASLADRIAASGASPAEQERLRERLVAPGAWRVEEDGRIEAATPARRSVAFEDPATGEALRLDLLAVETAAGTRYTVRPDALPLLASPADPDLYLLERNAAMFLFDARDLSVTFLGDAGERRARLAESSDERPLTWAQEPRWSPDGRFVAFLTNRDTLGEHFGTSIWVHELASGQEFAVLRGEAGRPVVSRGWTPENQVIAEDYLPVPGRAPRVSLVALGLDGSRRVLVPGATYVAQSRDARTLVWWRQSGELRALDLVDGRQSYIWRNESDGPRLRSLQVDFSADGRRLVTDLEDARHAQSLLVHDLETGESRPVAVRPGWQLALPAGWAADRLVLPLERPLEDGTEVRTFLLSPDEP